MTVIHCGEYTCKFRKDGICSVKEIALEPKVCVGEELDDLIRSHRNLAYCCKYEPTNNYIKYLKSRGKRV